VFHLHSRRAGLVAGLVLLFLPAFVHAQGTGAISGVVADASGGVIPGATITLRSTALPAPQVLKTDGAGAFIFRQLPPGAFAIEVSIEGFEPFRISSVVLGPAERRTLPTLTLRVKGMVVIDEVHMPEPPLIESDRAALGLVIPGRDLVELPLNGRNFTQLGTLMPGVIAPPAALGGQAGDATPGGFGNATGGFNVNGMRNQSNNFLLDGAPNNDSFNTGFVLRPPPDAIEEFRILTHAFGAEYGRNAGAVVSVVT
jgi:hypothetical protein